LYGHSCNGGVRVLLSENRKIYRETFQHIVWAKMQLRRESPLVKKQEDLPSLVGNKKNTTPV
jgi:hypothetical protein